MLCLTSFANGLTSTTRTAKPKKESPLGVATSEGAFPLGVKPMDYLYTFCFYYMRFSAKVKRCTESLQSGRARQWLSLMDRPVFVQPLRRFAPAPLVGEPLAKR